MHMKKWFLGLVLVSACSGAGQPEVVEGSTQEALQAPLSCDTADCCPPGTTPVIYNDQPNVVMSVQAKQCLVMAGGSDTVFLNGANGAILAGAGDDTIMGGVGAMISGGAGRDTINGFTGGTIYGGAGDDVIAGGNGDSFVYPGPGIDTVATGTGNDTVVIYDLCEVGWGEQISAGTGDDTLITPVPLDQLRALGVVVDGFEHVIVQQNSCKSECVAKPAGCVAGTECREGAVPGQITCGCPGGAPKAAPGQCGCGTPDTDTDGDGKADCVDVCSKDPAGNAVAVCGCGVPDTDTDGDGVADCKDECPKDPKLQHKGVCGCGDSPTAAGTACGDGACRGEFTCDGHGQCGDANQCIPAPGCTLKFFQNKYYWFCPGPVSWSQAETSCRAAQTSLAEVDGAPEDLFISKNLRNANTWIGANDHGAAGAWRWAGASSDSGDLFWNGAANGSRYFARYSAWVSGAPASGQDCATISASGQWQSASCSNAAGFVCEVPLHRNRGEFHPPTPTCKVLGLDCTPPAATGPCTPEANVFGNLTKDQLLGEFTACDQACANGNQNTQACADACADQAAPPPGGATCADFAGDELGACTLQSVTSPQQTCVSNADCPQNTVCGFFFECPEADRINHASTCFSGSSAQPGSVKLCGVPFDNCATNNADPDFQNAACGEQTICEPAQQQTVTDIGPATSLTPTPFSPEQTFGTPDPPKETPYFDETSPCNGAACKKGQAHPWCTLDMQDTLSKRAPQQPNKPASSGGNLVSFNFDPNFTLRHETDIGPFGVPDNLSISAEAGFNASVTYGIAGGGTVPIISVLAGIDGTQCGVASRTTLDLFGIDFMPLVEAATSGDFPLPFQIPSADDTNECQRAFATFHEAADRAKKAFRDAEELVRQYNALIANDDPTKPATIADNFSKSLCTQLVAQRPRGFPVGDCNNETPEATINRFIGYYERTVTGFSGLEGAIGLTESASNLAQKAFGFDKDFTFYNYNHDDEVTIAEVQFFIGPVPVNLEILNTVSYGADVGAHVEFRPGAVVDQMLRVNGDDAAQPIAFVDAGGRPYAGTGLAAFAGVGFGVPGFKVKLGIQSDLHLGTLYVPVHAGAGIGLGSEIDKRDPPPDMKGLVTGANLIPSKRYVVDLRYEAGLGLKVRDILSGDVKARLKIKIAFFSKSWSKTLLDFKGICGGDPDATLPSPCDVDLVSLAGSSDAASGSFPWGVVRGSMPFPQLTRLKSGAAPLGTGKVDPKNVEKLFFDSLCTCIDGNDISNSRTCFRNDDCCTNTPTCFSDPALGGTQKCILCRHGGASCNTKDDCCGKDSGAICMNNQCVGKGSCSSQCRNDDDCAAPLFHCDATAHTCMDSLNCKPK